MSDRGWPARSRPSRTAVGLAPPSRQRSSSSSGAARCSASFSPAARSTARPTCPPSATFRRCSPRNRAELKYGAALAINAGLVEELLFRLALPALIFGVTGSAVAAVTASILIFGLLHIYQGLPGIIGSVILGTAFMTIYLATGSIVIAIEVHALFDLRSLVLIPVVVFKVHRGLGNEAPKRERVATGAGRCEAGRTPGA